MNSNIPTAENRLGYLSIQSELLSSLTAQIANGERTINPPDNKDEKANEIEMQIRALLARSLATNTQEHPSAPAGIKLLLDLNLKENLEIGIDDVVSMITKITSPVNPR